MAKKKEPAYAEAKRATELIASCKARLHKAEEEVSKILE